MNREYVYKLIRTNGDEQQYTVRLSSPPDFEELNSVWKEHFPGTNLERVRVIVDGKYMTMFVDETGIHKDLDPNPEATIVYWENTRQHDPDRYEMYLQHGGPAIHGDVLLWEDEVWL